MKSGMNTKVAVHRHGMSTMQYFFFNDLLALIGGPTFLKVFFYCTRTKIQDDILSRIDKK
jgi:hypothetical protein